MIKLEDYLIPSDASEQEIGELMRDPIVRICNIYTIVDKKGRRVPFRPRPAQLKILEEIYVKGHKRILVPKSRQHGVSTLFEVILLDISLFTPNQDKRTGEPATIQTPEEFLQEIQTKCAIVERSKDQAVKRMNTIKIAWDSLPPILTAGTGEANPWNQSECSFVHGSSITAGLSARGDTITALHVSEWGVIAYNDPARAQEIEDGALESVPIDGYAFGESTHMGGRGGRWYDKVTDALETPPEHKTDLDFWVVFLGWWEEPTYTLEGDASQISDRINTYLDEKEAELHKDPDFQSACPNGFTAGQRLWYYKKEQSKGRSMFSEYPTVIEECWMAPSPGLIYAGEMDRARAEARITNSVAHYEQLPVYNVFDLGAPVNTVCWQYQLVGDHVNLLGCLYGGEDCKTAADWTRRFKAQSRYAFGGTFLPHDGEVTWLNAFQEAGLDGVVCMTRPVDVWQNINEALGAISRVRWHKDGCKDGITGLDAYHSKEENDGATIRDIPVHDWSSHPATAFGYIFQAIREGLHVDRSALPAKGIDRSSAVVTHRVGRTAIVSPHGARVTVSRNR